MFCEWSIPHNLYHEDGYQTASSHERRQAISIHIFFSLQVVGNFILKKGKQIQICQRRRRRPFSFESLNVLLMKGVR